MKRHPNVMFLLLAFMAACQGSSSTDLPPPGVTVTLPASSAPLTNESPVSALPTATHTLTPTFTPTPNPYADLTIESLASRDYGGGEVTVLEVLETTNTFTRYLVQYPSDGLTIYGFANLPFGEGPFPVVILVHGYIDPEAYTVQPYTTRYADRLAEAGYLVIHPNLRNYPPSDLGPNLFRVGYAIDVMNLIAIVRQQSGQPGLLQAANSEAIGLWGHSMGGGITLRVITAGAEVKAAVLYGSMSGDERQNFEHILNVLSDGERGFEELDVPPEALSAISPIYHLGRITVPVSVHHSDADEVVPVEWSIDLCERLGALGKTVECFIYSGEPHTFWGFGDYQFLERTLAFFAQYLR